MKQIIEHYRLKLIIYCLQHCKNNICNFIIFKLLNKKEISKLSDILNSIKQHRKLKENFYG